VQGWRQRSGRAES